MKPEISIPEKPVSDKATFDLLATVVQRTFGKQSGLGHHHYCSFKLQDDKHLLVTFVTICTVNSKHPMHPFMKKQRDEAMDLVKNEIKRVAEDYKKDRAERVNEESKKTISLKILNDTLREELEYVQTTLYANTKKAYYKMWLRLEVE